MHCTSFLDVTIKIIIKLKKKKKLSIIPGSEWKVPLGLCKPLAGHCSLSHQEEFWLIANPFFGGKLTKSA